MEIIMFDTARYAHQLLQEDINRPNRDYLEAILDGFTTGEVLDLKEGIKYSKIKDI
jgi:hypothetical protein